MAVARSLVTLEVIWLMSATLYGNGVVGLGGPHRGHGPLGSAAAWVKLRAAFVRVRVVRGRWEAPP